jgi:CheY-like chemotaxis protein
MDGRSFFRELRSRGDQTPVVILSAYNADRACRELGAEAALDKPADPDAIGTLVRELLNDATPSR